MFDDNYKYDNIIYNTELDYDSPRISQPVKIKRDLKPHQLACVFKATMMENVRKIKYST